MKNIFAVIIMAISTTILTAAEPVEGMVVKYPLNVRAGAGMKYTAVAQLDKNNPVVITAVSPKWLAIKPPANSRVWVPIRYIKNGKLASTVNLRSGPGTGYEALGIGRRNLKVTVHGKATASGWIQITAPDHIAFYVGRPAIKADAEKLKKLPVFKAPGGRALPNEELITLEGNFTSPGKNVSQTGYLYDTPTEIKSLTHVLFKEKAGELVPDAFIMSNRINLSKYNGKKVKVTGELFKVKNWDKPVIILKIITLAE